MEQMPRVQSFVGSNGINAWFLVVYTTVHVSNEKQTERKREIEL